MDVPSINSNDSVSDGPSSRPSTRSRSKNKKPRFPTHPRKTKVSETSRQTGRLVSTKHLLKALANEDIEEEADSSSLNSSLNANVTIQEDDSPKMANQDIQEEADPGSLNSALNISATFPDVSPISANHNISRRPDDVFRSSTILRGTSPKTAYHDTHERVDNDSHRSLPNTHSRMQMHVAPSTKKTHQKDLKSAHPSEKEERCSAETVKILKAITDLGSSIGDQIESLCLVIQGFKNLNPTVGAMCDFMEEHKVKIPISNIQEFQDFDSKLTDDSGFRESFKVSLRLLLNSDNNIGKSTTSILKKYLTREVAKKYTAVKKVGKKLVFKETTFCRCMKDVIISSHVDKAGNPSTEHVFYHSVGTSLANSKDWEGHRKKRAEEAKAKGRRGANTNVRQTAAVLLLKCNMS